MHFEYTYIRNDALLFLNDNVERHLHSYILYLEFSIKMLYSRQFYGGSVLCKTYLNILIKIFFTTAVYVHRVTLFCYYGRAENGL